MYMCTDDDSADDVNELNSQLFAAARTNELLTSLRLLAHGARPDWVNPERANNSSLHVAASSNQALQIELLAVYGGNPALLNDDRKSPEDMAHEKGYYSLANRLIEIRFEILGSGSKFYSINICRVNSILLSVDYAAFVLAFLSRFQTACVGALKSSTPLELSHVPFLWQAILYEPRLLASEFLRW